METPSTASIYYLRAIKLLKRPSASEIGHGCCDAPYLRTVITFDDKRGANPYSSKEKAGESLWDLPATLLKVFIECMNSLLANLLAYFSPSSAAL